MPAVSQVQKTFACLQGAKLKPGFPNAYEDSSSMSITCCMLCACHPVCTVVPVPAVAALAEAQVACAMSAALVHAGLLGRLVTQVPSHAI